MKVFSKPNFTSLYSLSVNSVQKTVRSPNSNSEKSLVWDKRLGEVAKFATKAEGVAIPIALLLPFATGWLNNSQFTSQGIKTPSILKSLEGPGLSNLILDFLSMLGEYKGGFSMIGNAVRVLADILLIVPKEEDSSKNKINNKADSNPLADFINGIGEKFISTIYLLASAFIGIGWSFDTNKLLRDKLNEKPGLLNKLNLQREHYLEYWLEDLPKNLTNKTLLKEKSIEFRQKPLESIGKLARHTILLHSALSFLALPFIIAGSLLAKPSNNQHESIENIKNSAEATNENKDNDISKAGWFIAGLARLPLVISTFASAFNKDQRQEYKMVFSLASGVSAILAMARTVFPWSTWLDFFSNTVSTFRSYISRNGRNTK